MSLLKANNPVIQPAANTKIIEIFRSDTAERILSYCPSISRRKLPDTPGNIMAHMAMAPARKVNQIPSGELTAGMFVKKYAATIPMSKAMTTAIDHFLMSLKMMIADMMISPQKKDHTGIGYSSIKKVMILDKANMLVRIPINRDNRNPPLTCFQSCLKSSFAKSDKAALSNDFILSRSSSYMPVMRAMEPPDTPGTMSAAPMAIPLR